MGNCAWVSEERDLRFCLKLFEILVCNIVFALVGGRKLWTLW